MNKEDLRTALKLSPSTIAKMSKGEYVSMRVVDKVCAYFGVQPGDLLIHSPDKPTV
jgi:DNA-binding Xre family transcriptional regulator